jgi:hypothetical protein
VSRRNASVTPRIGSGGPRGTLPHVLTARAALGDHARPSKADRATATAMRQLQLSSPPADTWFNVAANSNGERCVDGCGRPARVQARLSRAAGARGARACLPACVGPDGGLASPAVGVQVQQGSPAEDAGLEAYFDFLVSVNGQRLVRATLTALSQPVPY